MLTPIDKLLSEKSTFFVFEISVLFTVKSMANWYLSECLSYTSLCLGRCQMLYKNYIYVYIQNNGFRSLVVDYSGGVVLAWSLRFNSQSSMVWFLLLANTQMDIPGYYRMDHSGSFVVVKVLCLRCYCKAISMESGMDRMKSQLARALISCIQSHQ